MPSDNRLLPHIHFRWTTRPRVQIIAAWPAPATDNRGYDPIHGDIPFTAGTGLSEDEVPEHRIIDHPWVQRLRQIHQLHGVVGQSNGRTLAVSACTGVASDFRDIPLRIDIARHIYRPHTHGPAAQQNFLYDSACDTIRPLADDQLFLHLPVSSRICRVYTCNSEADAAMAQAMDGLIGSTGPDDLTNM